MSGGGCRCSIIVCAASLLIGVVPTLAEDDADDLARKVSNPASFMISVPVHADFDFGRWSDGHKFAHSLDIEPVIPFAISPDWNIISHTDIGSAYNGPAGAEDGRFALGDITENLSFTPSHHGPFIWAFGPQFSLPTATRDEFGSGKLSMGPSGLLLLQTKTMSIGTSGSHMWSIAGEGDRPRVNLTELQPFVAWHIGQGRTISANLDFTCDWTAQEYALPVSLSYSKIVKLGAQTLSLSLGGKYWIARQDDGSVWGIKAGATFLFPQARTVR